MSKIKCQNGFTLVELLIVIAIIGIIAIIAIPSLLESIEKAKVAEFASEVNSIKASVATEYANNYDFGNSKFIIHGTSNSGSVTDAKKTLDIDGFQNVLNAIEISLYRKGGNTCLEFYFEEKTGIPSNKIIERIRLLIPNIDYEEDTNVPESVGKLAILRIDYNTLL
ncbi:MAG: prepilin-type N-terminal cleavage/methylation domain-containing protein [Paraclostridium sp.]